MNDSDKALEVFERVLLLQSQVDAIKEYILTQPGAPTQRRLDLQLFEIESRIRTGQKHRQQSDEFRRVIQLQGDAATLLQSLHNYLMEGKLEA
jgi:hypothetical protein